MGAQTDFSPLAATPINSPVQVVLPLVLDSSHAQRRLELQQWTRDYKEWKEWFARWYNRPEPGWWSAHGRQPRPEPPAWLPGVCGSIIDADEMLAEGCRLWRESERGDVAVLLEQQIAQTRTQSEAPQRSVWWQHIHVDALWPITQTGTGAFGVAGAHVTIPVTHRIQVFAAPGIILMRVPSNDARQSWSAATDWGFSYRMFNFRMPGLTRLSTLHFNIARVWFFSTDGLPLSRSVYLAGFSATFNPRPGPTRPR